MMVNTAKFEDMALAAEIMVTSFRSAFRDFVSPETMDACTKPENCRKMLEDIYREGKMHFLMGGKEGFICWQETENGTEIVAIHSLPESWGTGLGRALLREALRQIGGQPVYLWAFKENTRAQRFYEKSGFRWDGSERISEFDGALEVRYERNAPASRVQLVRAASEDAETIRAMQRSSFAELLEKYQDHDTNPANESMERILWKIQNPESFYYFIRVGEDTVGCIRVADAGNGARKRISPLYILPHHRGKGYAQDAMREAERIHGSAGWELDTILQEAGNCYLYEKMGYRRSAKRKVINDKMTIVGYEKE